MQGAGSAEQIAKMIGLAAQRNECDVLILARGGGSLEDLWSFNEEIVARAIYQCPLPIVTGIGHEIDFTIADFVADQRTPTPTAAAELITPSQNEIQNRLQQLRSRVHHLLQTRLLHAKEKLHWLSRHIQHPGRRVQDWSQRLDETQLRLTHAMAHKLRHSLAQVTQLHTQLQGNNPTSRVQTYQKQLVYLKQRVTTAMSHQLEQKSQALANLVHTLDTVSPLSTLHRGYAIVTRVADDQILRTVTQTRRGEQIRARLAHGQLLCKVETIENDPD